MAQTNYHYSGITFEFLSTSDAMLDLLETQEQGIDVFLLPANATVITPPAEGTDQVAVFNKGLQQWSIENDFRGNWYEETTGAVLPITDIGVSPPPGYTTTPPPGPGYEFIDPNWERTLPLAKKEKFQELNTDFRNAVSGTVPAEGTTWLYDEESNAVRAAYTVIQLQANTPMISVYDSLNVLHVLTKPQFEALMDAIVAAFGPEYEHYRAKQLEVIQAPDVPTVDAITY